MGRFCQKLLMLILGSLILYSNDVFASQKSYQIGNSEVTAKVDDGFERLVNKEYKPHFEKYVAKQSVSAEISYKGVSAAQKVAVGIESSVARSSVLKNVLARARLGGALVARGAGALSGPYGIALQIAAFYLVEQLLSDSGYKYDAKKQDFVTDKEYKYCLKKTVYDRNGNSSLEDVECVGLGVESYKLDSLGDSHLKQYRDAMCRKHWQDLLPDYRVQDGYRFGYSSRSGCTAVSDTDNGRSAGYFIWERQQVEPISQSKFNEIVGPKADAAPSQYVNVTANDDGTIPDENESSDVSVEKGTVVQLGPFTDKDGQAKQLTLTFGKDAQGRTTVSIKETPRPDLKPKSSEAPVPEKKPRTEIIPNPNPDKKPDTDSDKDKDKDGKEKPDSDGKPSDKEKPDPNGKPDGGEKPKPDDKPKTGLLCEMFPSILACAEMGDVEENEPFQVPNIKDETTFSPDNFLPSNGICPAPKTVNILGNSYTVSYDLLCRFAEMSRFLILAIAAVLAARIMFGSQKKD